MKKPIQFGKYYLLERVNVGGMAEVFKAKTLGVEGFERMLAVKRILPNIAEDQEFITMFIDEAKIAVQLNHANIAQIFDLGKVQESYFIALEYVAGKDLRALFDRCRQRPENGSVTMPIAQACFAIMKICEGLDYAHNKRDAGGKELHLVHRDVSPQNVIISFEGEVKLIDFGIAKAAGKASKTQAGILKGKFGYMSPEQVRGLPLDRRSDVFSVGIVLYELLTGERLFVGESDFSTLEKVRNVEILPPSAYNRKIPDDLERIVLKALAKDVDDRYQSAIDLHDDLQAFMYTAGEFYSRKELSAWMKRHFADEILDERKRDEGWRNVDLAAAAMPEPQNGKPKVKPSLPPAPSVQSAAPAVPQIPPAGKPAPKLAVVAAARGDEDGLNWDDDELETHVYDTPHAIDDAIEAEEEDIEDLDELELADDGEPVPAKPVAPRGPEPVHANGKRPGADEAFARTALAPSLRSGAAAAASPAPAAAPSNENRRTLPATPRQLLVQPSVAPAAPSIAPVSPIGQQPRPTDRVRPMSQPSVQPVAARTLSGTATPPSIAPVPARPSMGATPVSVPALTGLGREGRRRSQGPLFGAVGVGVVVVGALIAYLALRPTTGVMQLTVAPADGLRVTVDEQVVAAEELPHLVRQPGTHVITIERAGYTPWTDHFEVKAGGTEARRVVLDPLARAALAIWEPTGASATLDGTALPGVTPFKAGELAPGKHHLELKLGEKSLARDVDLAPGQTMDVRSSFDVAANPPPVVAQKPATPEPAPTPLPPPPQPTQPKIAPTPPPESPVAVAPTPEPATPRVSRHHVTPTDDGPNAEPQRSLPRPPPPEPKETPPEPKETVKETPPKPASSEGYLRIGSKPWTNIAIDGRDTGLRTPQLHLRLNPGPHRVALSNPQFGISESFTVDIHAGDTETVIKDLRPKPGDE